MIANPCCTLCYVLATNAPNIPKTNFSSLSRLDQNRAKNQLGLKLKVTPSEVENLIVWGNHSPTMFPNFEEAHVGGKKVTELITDEKYLREDFCMRVAKRGSEVLQAKGFSSVFPAGKALCDHLRDWYLGTTEGSCVSMGVYSDGSNYGIPKDMFCSVPVSCKGNFEYEVNTTVALSEFGTSKLKATVDELLNEKATSEEILNPKSEK